MRGYVLSGAPCPRKMEATNAAAPKPLSMLTTAMPLAHELSIPQQSRHAAKRRAINPRWSARPRPAR